MYNVGGKRISLKPGQRSIKWVPVGTEVKKADGFLYVKVSDIKKGHSKENWKQKHRLIWEKEYGPIPKGHKLVFADSDKTNIVLDNLLLVTNSEMLILNRNKLIYTDKSLTETGLLLAKIIKAQNGRMKKHERK